MDYFIKAHTKTKNTPKKKKNRKLLKNKRVSTTHKNTHKNKKIEQLLLI